MIKETTRKINFLSYTARKGKERDTSAPPAVRVNVKYGILQFGSRALSALQMEDKWIKLFYEPAKKIIAWKIVDKLDNEDIQSKAYRLVKFSKKTSNFTTSVAGILKEFDGLKKETYKCEVMRYRETSDLLNRGEVFYFIRLSDNPNQDE